MSVSTLKEVAEKANVSLATVSYVMNGKGDISDQTKERVLAAAEEVGYKSAARARKYGGEKENIMGIVTSNFRGPFFSQLLTSVEEAAIANGCHLMAYSTATGSSEQLLKHVFKTHRPSGLIVMAYNISDDILLKYSARDFPIVTIDRSVDGEHLWSVTMDNERGAYDAVRYLVSCGHREIAFMGGSFMAYETQARYMGYCSALKEAGIDVASQLYCQGGHTESGGYSTAKILIAQKRMPSALFCANDEMALGVMLACREAGIRIPDDLSLIGFDNIETAKYVEPALTTVRQPVDEVGGMALQTLIMAIHGNNPVKHMRIPTELVIRKSVKSVSD